MSTIQERNKQLVTRFFTEILPAAELTASIDELVDPEYVDHDPVDPAHARGVDAMRATHAHLHERFPGGVRFEVEEVIAEGDVVAMRWAGGPVRAMAWFRVRDGRLLERRAILRR